MVAVGVQGLRPLLAGRVAGLVGVPGLFAVVAELRAAAFSATHQPGTAGTARGDDGKSAVRRRAPSAVWIGGEAPPQQELLILLQQGRVIQDVSHLLRGQSLGALGAAELDSTLCDFNAEVLPQAAEAGAVAAPQQLRELFSGLAHQAQGALQEVGLSGGGGSTQGRLAGGEWL